MPWHPCLNDELTVCDYFRFMFASTLEDVTFTSWYPGQPDDYTYGGWSVNGDDYVQVYPDTGYWVDVLSSAQLNVICERDL